MIRLRRKAIRDNVLIGQEYENSAYATGKDANPILKDLIGETSLFWWIVPEKGLPLLGAIGGGPRVIEALMRCFSHSDTFQGLRELRKMPMCARK